MARGGKPRSKGSVVPGSYVALALVSIGTLFISCSDESTEGCGSACARAARLCEKDLTTLGQSGSFESTCLDTCRSAQSDNARQLGQDLGCVSIQNGCEGVRTCSTFGPLITTPPPGGFAGNVFGVGGFPECQGSLTQPCGCSNGTNGTQRCQGSRWSVCLCGTTGCSDTCFYSHNNLCDDGAGNSSTARCVYGTDCSDCGVRAGAGGFGGTFGGNGGLATGGRRFDASVDAPAPDASGKDAQTNDADSADATSADVITVDAPISGG